VGTLPMLISDFDLECDKPNKKIYEFVQSQFYDPQNSNVSVLF